MFRAEHCPRRLRADNPRPPDSHFKTADAFVSAQSERHPASASFRSLTKRHAMWGGGKWNKKAKPGRRYGRPAIRARNNKGGSHFSLVPGMARDHNSAMPRSVSASQAG
jgi:hypothetical protein